MSLSSLFLNTMSMAWTNTLAFCATELIKAVKKFYDTSPLYQIPFFTVMIVLCSKVVCSSLSATNILL
jgi:hypothetical protein